MRADVVDHQLADGGAGLDGGAALVRLHDHIREREQFGRGIRLVVENVKRGMAEPPLRQRLDERRLIDDRAARDVDQRPFGPSASITAAETRWRVSGPPLQATMR